MTSAQAGETFEERPFIAAMERPSVCETTLEMGKKIVTLDGMLTRLQQTACDALDRIRERVENRQHEHAPKDYAEDDEDLRTVMKAFVDMARYAQRNPSPGPGSINGMRSKLMDAVIWVILAVSAWNLKATIDNSRDIAVLQCQINPSCAQAVVRGKQP